MIYKTEDRGGMGKQLKAEAAVIHHLQEAC